MPDLDYYIVQTSDRDQLISTVKRYIGDGWGLLGSAFIVPRILPGEFFWCQSLYKDTELVSGKETRVQIEGFNRNSR